MDDELIERLAEPDHIPDGVVERAIEAYGIHKSMREAIVAAINAWPNMRMVDFYDMSEGDFDLEELPEPDFTKIELELLKQVKPAE